MGHTALHILCNGSGVDTCTAPIIEELIDNGVVPLNAFSNWRNDKVGVFPPGSVLRQIAVGKVNINWPDW